MAALTAAVCAMAAVDLAHAQMNMADAGRGRVLSDRLCTGCHITSAEAGTTIANTDVPSFAAIAKRPDISAEHLAGRILIPHPAMPTTQLTVGEIRDIICLYSNHEADALMASGTAGHLAGSNAQSTLPR